MTKKTKRAMLKADLRKLESEKRKIERKLTLLRQKLLLLSDNRQRFEEKEEVRVISKRPKKVETHLVGRVYWSEKFKDESTGKSITIERSQVVRVNGVWQFPLNY